MQPSLFGEDPKSRKIREAWEILSALGVPTERTERRRERIAMALLAVANLKLDSEWSEACCWRGPGSHSLLTREIITFWNSNFGEGVSSGSYDDVRRKDLIKLVEAGLVVRAAGLENANTNTPTRRYALAEDAWQVLSAYGAEEFDTRVNEFVEKYGRLENALNRPRVIPRREVCLPQGVTVALAPGQHNDLQAAIVQDFIPRYLRSAKVLYIGDTADRDLFLDIEGLQALGIAEIAHDALPDVIAFDQDRDWLFLFEAVSTANPIDPLRHLTLERLIGESKRRAVYVSVFKDRQTLRGFVAEIGWETEVWLADDPDHMIHFDGERFLGPY
jgi:hypothetical protein